jgi:hypothetical protein
MQYVARTNEREGKEYGRKERRYEKDKAKEERW